MTVCARIGSRDSASDERHISLSCRDQRDRNGHECAGQQPSPVDASQSIATDRSLCEGQRRK